MHHIWIFGGCFPPPLGDRCGLIRTNNLLTLAKIILDGRAGVQHPTASRTIDATISSISELNKEFPFARVRNSRGFRVLVATDCHGLEMTEEGATSKFDEFENGELLRQ